jgi:hypothetical protein
MSTRLKAEVLLSAIAALLSLARLGAFDHAPIVCPLRGLTGVPCGSCGLTRAAAALTHGDLAGATRMHAGAIPLSLILLLVCALLTCEIMTGRAMLRPMWRARARAIVWIVLPAILLGWGFNLSRFVSERQGRHDHEVSRKCEPACDAAGSSAAPSDESAASPSW